MTESQEHEPGLSLYDMVAELYEAEHQKASIERDKLDLWREQMDLGTELRAGDEVWNTFSLWLAQISIGLALVALVLEPDLPVGVLIVPGLGIAVATGMVCWAQYIYWRQVRRNRARLARGDHRAER